MKSLAPPPELGRGFHPPIGPTMLWWWHRGLQPTGVRGGPQSRDRHPKTSPAALATQPWHQPRLLLTAAHSSGTAALFTLPAKHKSRPSIVITGCCKPRPAHWPAKPVTLLPGGLGAVTPSAELRLAAEPRPRRHARLQTTRASAGSSRGEAKRPVPMSRD